MEGCDFFGIPVQKVDRANYLGDILQSGGKNNTPSKKSESKKKNVLFASLFCQEIFFCQTKDRRKIRPDNSQGFF